MYLSEDGPAYNCPKCETEIHGADYNSEGECPECGVLHEYDICSEKWYSSEEDE